MQKHYTLTIEHNDGRVLSWDCSEELYAKLLYCQWKRIKVINNIKSGQLYDNWTHTTIYSFGMRA